MVTAGLLVCALYRPLRSRALFPGWKADVRWRLPQLQGALNFVAYAGPICGVLITKVIIYGGSPSFGADLPHIVDFSRYGLAWR